MRITDYFKPIHSMSAEEVRKLLKGKDLDAYNLIDVRQPKEYEGAHIPGARLVPLGEIKDHLGGFNPEKPTIAY